MRRSPHGLGEARPQGDPLHTLAEASNHAMKEAPAIREILRALHAARDPERAAREERYLKSELRHLGVSVWKIREIVGAFAKRHPGVAHADLVALVEDLWSEPVHERRMAAVQLLETCGALLERGDLPLVERLIRESRTWALVDILAATVAGGLVERFPELAEALDGWATDEDFWVRRSALLALLKPLRRGEGDFDRFARYADGMLEERQFFIRKAIGWVLRETGKKRPELVAAWLRPRAARASGVTVREAVKYLPEADRAAVLRAHRKPKGPAGASRTKRADGA